MIAYFYSLKYLQFQDMYFLVIILEMKWRKRGGNRHINNINLKNINIYSKVSFKARYSSPAILLSAHHDNPRRGKEPKKRGDKNEGDNGKRKLDALV